MLAAAGFGSATDPLDPLNAVTFAESGGVALGFLGGMRQEDFVFGSLGLSSPLSLSAGSALGFSADFGAFEGSIVESLPFDEDARTRFPDLVDLLDELPGELLLVATGLFTVNAELFPGFAPTPMTVRLVLGQGSLGAGTDSSRGAGPLSEEAETPIFALGIAEIAETAVPLPGAAALFGAGLLGLAAVGRRPLRRRAAAA